MCGKCICKGYIKAEDVITMCEQITKDAYEGNLDDSGEWDDGLFLMTPGDFTIVLKERLKPVLDRKQFKGGCCEGNHNS